MISPPENLVGLHHCSSDNRRLWIEENSTGEASCEGPRCEFVPAPPPPPPKGEGDDEPGLLP